MTAKEADLFCQAATVPAKASLEELGATCLDESCAICLDSLNTAASGEEQAVQIRLCGHRYHRACIRLWVMRQGYIMCPVCRQTVDPFHMQMARTAL